MVQGDWDQVAEWWDAKQGDSGDLWHRSLIDPGLLRVVGDVRGLRVLDLACGNGYLARRFARAGASVQGIDRSAPIIERARAREAAEPLGIRYEVGDAARLSAFGDGAFDLVVSNMALMDIADAAGCIGEAGRVLAPGGRFVFSISHPCFDVMSRSAWVVERDLGGTTVWRKVRRYREPFDEWIPWDVGEGATMELRSFHRPLGWYVEQLRSAGLAIVHFEEPSPLDEMLRESPEQGPWIAQIPLHCVIGAVRL